MLIYAIRHGQTDHNLNRIVQGWSDNPLNAFGEMQAYQLGTYLKQQNIAFDLIISSPLKRTLKTAEIIQQVMNTSLPVEIEPLFIERDFGVFEGKSVDETMPIIYVEGFKCDGYEHDEALLRRIHQAVQTIYLKHPTKTILLSIHSHVIKSLLILSDPLRYNFQTLLNNGSMCIFNYDGNHLENTAFNIEVLDK